MLPASRRSRRAHAVLFAALLLLPTCAHAAPLDGRDPRDDIFYQIMPIAWRDSLADANRFGDFPGMTASLPYLRGLGVTAMWMTPIFTSPAYHGYQHMPPDQLNPWFGSEQQFFDFVHAAHQDSVKVFIDLVAYGVSTNSTYFQQSYLQPTSPYTDYLGYLDPHTGNSQYDGGTYTTWNGSPVGFIRWNNGNAGATSVVTNGCKHWLDPNGDGDPSDGIDGYRLDHVLANDTRGYTIGWWQTWKAAMQSVNPSVFTFCEQADWGSHGQDLLSAHDACFTKPFEFAARSAIAAENASALYSEMAATLASLPAGKLYLCTLGDHDVDRLISAIGDDFGRARVAAAVLMTQPFPPIIYNGDEIGMHGTKANFGSDNNDIPNREPFKWNAVDGPPMSHYYALNGPAYTNRIERDHDGRSVEEQQGVSGSLLETYRSLIALRRAHVALRRGDYAAVPNGSQATWAFSREAAGQETLLVAINLSNATVNATLDLTNFVVTAGRSKVRDVIGGGTLADLTTANQAAYAVSVPAHGWRVLDARVHAVPPPATDLDGRAIPADAGASALVASQNAPAYVADNHVELDQMFAQPQATGLRLGVTGNLPTDGTALALLIDSQAGGQDTLRTASLPAPPNGPAQLDGLVMDAGFTPDYLLWINPYSGTVYCDLFTLPKTGGSVHRYLGSTAMDGGSGTLSGGSNPNGFQVAFDDSNLAGITASSVANAGTATQGCEAFLPYADLGVSTGASLRLLAAIIAPDGRISNQLLPGIGPGPTSLGYAPLSLRAFAGNQFVTISTALAVPAAPVTMRRLTTSPNPFRDSTTLRFALPRAGTVRIEILDAQGRRVRALGPANVAAGAQQVGWDGRDEAGRRVAPGLYLARVIAGEQHWQAKLVRAR